MEILFGKSNRKHESIFTLLAHVSVHTKECETGSQTITERKVSSHQHSTKLVVWHALEAVLPNLVRSPQSYVFQL